MSKSKNGSGALGAFCVNMQSCYSWGISTLAETNAGKYENGFGTTGFFLCDVGVGVCPFLSCLDYPFQEICQHIYIR